jgi:hypothetical protein
MIAIGLVSIALAAARTPVAPLTYWLIPFVMWINGTIAGKRRRQLKARLAGAEQTRPA